MVEAVVEFDYVAREPDELSIRKGDIITNIRTHPGGWWEGSLRGKRGMFPDNFIKVQSESEASFQDVTLRRSSVRRCRVLFSYQPANEDELALQVNDVIEVVGEVEEGWWKGKVNDSVGVFPSNFVMELVDEPAEIKRKPRTSSKDEATGESEGEASTSVSSPDSTAKSEQDNEAPSLPPKPVKELCLVLFPYAASNDDELNLKEGDVITLLSREVQDVGWWKGELRGKVGVFPDNFVEVIQHEEGPKKPDRPPSKSPLVTTNRTRDSITKPSLLKGDIGEATVKKPVTEAPSKTEEKTSPAPPILGKKPSLPIKKPNRASDPPSKPSSKPVDAVDGASHSRTSHLVPKSNSPSTRAGGIDTREDVAEFDSVERSAMLHHPTASRAKAPRRRPPTFNKDNEAPTKLMNGSAEERPPLLENHTLPEDGEEGIEEDEGGARGGRSWEREKNKPPWMEELKLNQARKSSSLSPTAKNSPGPLSPTLLSVGSGPTAGERRQPLATSASRGKIDTTHGPGKLTSPQHSTTENDSIMENLTNNSRHSSVAAVRHHVVRPQSMYTGDNPNRPSPHARPLSVSTSPEQSRLLSELNRVILPTTSSPVLPSNIPTSKPDSTTSLSSLSEADMLGSPASSPFVSYKQFLELKDMVSKLEHKLDKQREDFTKTVNDLALKLSEEMEQRFHIQKELDKLSNLVTQV